MAFAPAAERAGKALRVDTDPDVFLCGDEAAIRQLTSILMDNAVKYADAGGEICVRLLGGKHPVLCVENDFQNVDALELSRLFDRIYRADPARAGDGSHGLGLSIARSTPEAHRASIRAEKADAAACACACGFDGRRGDRRPARARESNRRAQARSAGI